MTILNKRIGLLLTAAALAISTAPTMASLVTFQVDMTSQPSATSVFVRGSFNNWGNSPQVPWPLTNNGAGIYSMTYDLTNAPGTVESCKFFYQPGDNWEGDPNRQFVLSGGPQTLPLTAWNANDWPLPTNYVTFQIDMSQQVALGNFTVGAGYVRVSGAFNTWNESADFTNNPSAPGLATNIYSQTVAIQGFPGSFPGGYKFRAPIGDTYETIANRPSFQITNVNQTLPVVFWNDVAFGAPTNNVTVRVDMTAKVLTGAFTNNGGIIRVSGGFTGWGDGADLTNNPALSGNASNVYSMVFPIVGFPGVQHFYKFRMNNGWESPASGVPPDQNRVFAIAGGNQVLPLVFYNDDSVCDLLLADTAVTFVLHITNGTPNRDGVGFVKGTDKIYINGQFCSWLDGYGNWNDGIVNPFVDANVINAYGDLELTNNPIGSDTYQQTLHFKAGLPLQSVYKFSFNGFDNELGFGVNHTKYVRTTTASYTMPTSYFGTNFTALLSEKSFGDLTAAPASGGVVPINWLGRQCVTLQTKPTVTGSWTDLPTTDGKSSTNFPNLGGAQFFRLQKRNNL